MTLPDDYKLQIWNRKHPPSQRAQPKKLKPVNMEGGLKIGSCPPISEEKAARIDKIAAEVRERLEE